MQQLLTDAGIEYTHSPDELYMFEYYPLVDSVSVPDCFLSSVT